MAAADKWIADANCDTPTGEVARCALQTRLRGVIHYLPLAAHLADEDVEHVHAARVATRRAGAALRLFADFLPAGRMKRMKGTLRDIRNSMGEARDLDVYLRRFEEADDPATCDLARRLAERRRAVQPVIIEAAQPLLAGEKLRRRVAKLLRKAGKHAPGKLRREPFGDWAIERLAAEWQLFAQGVPGDEPSAAELHEFRIAAKHFRYALELLSGGLPDTLRKQLYPEVKQLQNRLGEIQDHAAAADRLATWRKAADSRRERKLLKKLEQQERNLYEGKTAAFTHWWRHDRIEELQAAVDSLGECERERA